MFAALAPRLTTLKTFGLPIATLSILSARLDSLFGKLYVLVYAD